MNNHVSTFELLHISLPSSCVPPKPSRRYPHPRQILPRLQSTFKQEASSSEHLLHPSNPPSTNTPLVDAIFERGNRTHEAPFHVPGHKRGTSVPPTLTPMLSNAMRYDLTELDGLDYLSSPEGPILEAQQLAAEAWGAQQTWFLVNGTTVGIHAAVMATCSGVNSSQNALILARNAHQSGFNAAVLAGCAVEYALPITAHGLAHHLTPESLESAFQRAKSRNLTPKAALAVSPTYFGVISDVAALAEVCHRHGAYLIIDEAHGAHLKSLSDAAIGKHLSIPNTCTTRSLFVSALQAGADLVVQSTHKQLGCLTQGAMLHLGENKKDQNTSSLNVLSKQRDQYLLSRVDSGKISRALSILQTSSPSYLIMASLDAARAQAQEFDAMRKAHAAALMIHDWFEKNAKKTNLEEERRKEQNGFQDLMNFESNLSCVPHLRLMSTKLLPCGSIAWHDPWRFTVLLQGMRRSGWAASAALEQKCGVVAELATKNSIVFAVGIGSTVEHAAALISGLEWLVQDEKETLLREVSANKATQVLDVATDSSGETIMGCYRSNNGIAPSLESSFQQSEISNTSDTNTTEGAIIRESMITYPEVVCTPREALNSEVEVVPFTAAAGRVSAELLCPYPPGVPAVYPGERMSKEVLEVLRNVMECGGKVVGAADGSFQTLRVLQLSSCGNE